MSDSSENTKYKWTPDSTALLVSVWSDKQVQKQLEYTKKPQLIWESIARYMRKKGYGVTAKNCRSRMKQLLVCYREAKRANTRAGVEQYYESIDRVLKNRRLEQPNDDGIDTVDSCINTKSPPKELKTNKNLQMRHKFQEPVESLYRTEALSPTWITGHENEYPDSPESNETIIARPFGMLSPTRDIGINTADRKIKVKPAHRNYAAEELQFAEDYPSNHLLRFPCCDIPLQNAVQNVQNQIIQENMQQHQTILQQNRLCNQKLQQNLLHGNMNHQHNILQSNMIPQQNYNGMNQGLGIQQANDNIVFEQNQNVDIIRHYNQLQQNAGMNNRAMPQEPRKIVFGPNLAATYKQYRDGGIKYQYSTDNKQNGSLSPDNLSDTAPNLNDAFCQTMDVEGKVHNLNETYTQPIQNPHVPLMRNNDATVLTTNATFNDDSFILELMADSPTASESGNKLRETAVNTDFVPDVPARRKKAQKLEQLVLNAISSQNDVVNKILSAQNDLVAKFLNIGKDRQDKLEQRLEQLLNVVHSTVLNKNSESDVEIPPPPTEPLIASLAPPIQGVVPPKLDLVPPKPCRVPCTVANTNIELINKNSVQTRPGIVSPITSPGRKPGSIWSKLGPVSQSPFVKAQQRLGYQSAFNGDIRTKSSAERRIVKEIENSPMSFQNIIFETKRFLEVEKHIEERIENARLESKLGQNHSPRRRLFTQQEPTVITILTAAFLEAECREAERAAGNYKSLTKSQDEILSGQGEGYDKLRNINRFSNLRINEPNDSSTPAKVVANLPKSNNDEEDCGVPRQTIQQLARLVMNSGRWRDTAHQNQQKLAKESNPITNNYKNQNFIREAPIVNTQSRNEERPKSYPWANPSTFTAPIDNSEYNTLPRTDQVPKPKFPMGFTTTMLDAPSKPCNFEFNPDIGFTNKVLPERKQPSVRFSDDALIELQRMCIQRNMERGNDQPASRTNENLFALAQNRFLIENYAQDAILRKQYRSSKSSDSDDEEFLDTTMSMQPSSHKNSLTSIHTASSGNGNSGKGNKAANCIIS